jgi:hypothetical protein
MSLMFKICHIIFTLSFTKICCFCWKSAIRKVEKSKSLKIVCILGHGHFLKSF